MKTYAAYFNNIVREESSSGGVFSLIASRFDVIYGVEMSSDNSCAVYARKTDDISSLRGSKYIQARVGDTFKQVKRDLEEGKTVLFSGTACQVNGLHSFLQREFSNLFCVDVICHGVPTPLYWQKYIEGQRIDKVNFRAKDEGWENYTYGMKLNSSFIPYYDNKYMDLYIKNLALRPSCYECLYKKAKKSDITIGDFWGIEKLDSSMTDNKGTSVVILRSEKGQDLFDSIKHDLVYKEVAYEDCVKENVSEYRSSSRPNNRDAFFGDLHTMSFQDLYRKYCPSQKTSNTSHYLNKMKRLIKKIAGRTKT